MQVKPFKLTNESMKCEVSPASLYNRWKILLRDKDLKVGLSRREEAIPAPVKLEQSDMMTSLRCLQFLNKWRSN
jgi:hypothetical protein